MGASAPTPSQRKALREDVREFIADWIQEARADLTFVVCRRDTALDTMASSDANAPEEWVNAFDEIMTEELEALRKGPESEAYWTSALDIADITRWPNG